MTPPFWSSAAARVRRHERTASRDCGIPAIISVAGERDEHEAFQPYVSVFFRFYL
ncbi:MAG TPA: hypothetical protein VJ420_08015 [Candidatus Udaeobacter sp.]|nr:hypothetical protein [Candidatus Udaeobacter sp.]